VRSLSHFLLLLEAIALLLLTVFGGVFLLGGAASVWEAAWNGQGHSDALTWIAILGALVAAWWLLLAYFYRGHRGARRVPIVVWIYAAIAGLVAIWEAAASPLLPGPAILFVPTFIHLSAEVWLWPPATSRERE
jgi:hypothetical protein